MDKFEQLLEDSLKISEVKSEKINHELFKKIDEEERKTKKYLESSTQTYWSHPG